MIFIWAAAKALSQLLIDLESVLEEFSSYFSNIDPQILGNSA
jgi:hypothetical protein